MKHEQALALSPAAAGPAVDFSGRWLNELGSDMNLTIAGDAVSGTYTSTVSGSGKKISGPVTGFVSGRIISFVVNWPNASVTTWVGHMVTEAGEDIIETLWYLATNTTNPGNPTELWDSILAGADRFHR